MANPADQVTEARVAIITGGSRGIGRQVAQRLAAEGYHLVINYLGNVVEAELTVRSLTELGARAIAVPADVSDVDAMADLFDQAELEFGGVDVLIHAAGVMAPPAPIAELDLATLDRLLRVNVRGAFIVAQQAARRLRSGGAIITFSTSQIKLQHAGYSAYVATKAAVESFTLILARELRGRDITVNTVAPGPTGTALFLDGKDEQAINWFAAQPPLERLGTPADIAEAVAFLAGPARWVNGQVLRVNGGIA
jgi:3-oxoacyl-[acyl-carrier protein] reductase